MVHCCLQRRTRVLDAILSYYLLKKEELLMTVLTMPVKCFHKSAPSTMNNDEEASTFHIPLLGLLFQYCNNSYGGFLLQRVVERMSQEQFDRLGVNENGDNILHLFAQSVKSPSMSGSLLLALIRKSPSLMQAENSMGETPSMFMSIPESYLEHCVEKELGGLPKEPLSWNCEKRVIAIGNQRKVLKFRRKK